MSNNPGATKSLPEEYGGPLEASLQHLVENSRNTEPDKDELAPSEKREDSVHTHGSDSKKWIKHLWPSSQTLDKLFSYEHMGNFVIDRQTGRKIFESMPLYVRVGMHLLFVDGNGYMSYPSIEKMLLDQSLKQGKLYDTKGPQVQPHIKQFISTYSLPMDELLVQDLEQYETFNAFFARRLKATARPITSPKDPKIITSPADCRMTAFETVDEAKQFWIKGQKFTIPSLLTGGDESVQTFKDLTGDNKCAVVVSRLAPQDYHRFHSPVDGVCGEVKDIQGELYTVNPQAVNEDLNVFTQNKRSVMLIKANLGQGKEETPIAFVAIGAMLVGSIGWSKKPGDKVLKGEELGWFQYGGSTCITIIPSSAGVKIDDDIKQNSQKSMETLVKVGMEIASVQ